MTLTIRRLTEADAKVTHAFLDKFSKEDPESGMEVVASEDLLAMQVRDGLASWVAFDKGKLVGILGPEMRGIQEFPDGEVREFGYFNRLAVDHSLYLTSRSQAVQVARELTLAAADDVKATGTMPKWTRVVGPTVSRGSSWCRLLGFEEIREGRSSEFWLETKLIWERCKATEAF